MIKELLLASTLIMPLSDPETIRLNYDYQTKEQETITEDLSIQEFFNIKINFHLNITVSNAANKRINTELSIFDNDTDRFEYIGGYAFNSTTNVKQVSTDLTIKPGYDILTSEFYNKNNEIQFHFFIDNYDYMDILFSGITINFELIPKNQFYNYSLNNFLFNYNSDGGIFEKLEFSKGQNLFTDNYRYVSTDESIVNIRADKKFSTKITLDPLTKQTLKGGNFKIKLYESRQLPSTDIYDEYSTFKIQASNILKGTEPDTSKTDLIPIRACPTWYDLPCQAMNGLAKIINNFPFLGDFLGKIKGVFITPILALTDFLKGIFGL